MQLEGGVVHEDTVEGRIVVFAGPALDGITMAAFLGSVGAKQTFPRADGAFIDGRSGSRWTIEGVAIEGPQAGTRLTLVRSFYVRWLAWITGTDRPGCSEAENEPSQVWPGQYEIGFGAVHERLTGLAERGHDARFDGLLVSQQRPVVPPGAFGCGSTAIR